MRRMIHGRMWAFVVTVPLLLAMLVLPACGGEGAEDDASADDEMVTITFPHMEGAELVAGVSLEPDALPFEAEDSVATLHVVDGEPIDVSNYYNAPTAEMRANGWEGGSLPSEQWVVRTFWRNGDDIAFIWVIPGRAMPQFAAEIDEINLGPFEGETGRLSEDTNLVYTRYATCLESEASSCAAKLVETFRQS